MSALLDELGPRENQASRESWRYSRTALRALERQDFVMADGSVAVPDSLRERYEIAGTSGPRIVFVNGVFSASHSDFADDGRIEIIHTDRDSRLTILESDFNEPLHLVYLSIPGSAPSRWSHALTISAPGGVSIIEHHLGEAGTSMLGATQFEIDVAENTAARIATLCELPDSTSLFRRESANIKANSDLHSILGSFGGRLQRHEIDVELAGKTASHTSRGLFVLGARQHMDTQLNVRHAARETACDLVWRGIAGGHARGILHGGITINEGADGSEASLSNKNLLLSGNAEIDTQPVLEIHADEVKAAHGATVGQLDPTALFYLRSRGIAEADARRLLTEAFCREVIGAADDGIRDAMDAALQRALARLSESA